MSHCNRISTVAVLLLTCATARSMTLRSMPVAELVQAADVVAVVEVVRGELLHSGTQSCGAKYSARVLERIKGLDPTVTEIEFGPYARREIGGKYLVFLTTGPRRFRALTSSNSFQQEAEARVDADCVALRPEHQEMHEGTATLVVSWTTKFDYQDGVKFVPKYVRPPVGMSTTPAAPGDNKIVTEEVWVRLPDALAALRTLAAPASAE